MHGHSVAELVPSNRVKAGCNRVEPTAVEDWHPMTNMRIFKMISERIAPF